MFPSLILAFLIESVRPTSKASSRDKGSFGKVIKSKGVIGASLACSFFFFLLQSIITFYPVYALREYHADPDSVAMVWSLFYFVVMIARSLAVTVLPSRIGEKRLITTALMISTSVALLPLTKSLEQSAILTTLTGVAHGIVYPMGAILIAKSTSSSERGTANSIYILFVNLNTTLGPVLMGFVAEAWGINVIFPLLAIAPVIGLISSKYMP